MLSIEQDAYGRIIRDHLEGIPSREIVERDDGWIDTSSGAQAYFAPFAEWPERQQEAAGLAAGRVLDVGCGAGRWCLHLQEQGHEVLGVDVSPLAVEVCLRRGVHRAELIPITRLTRALGTFDTILMMGNNFGLFGGERRARWLLRRFHGLTSPGARILAESTDPYATQNPYHLAYQERNRRRGRMAGQLRIRIRYGLSRTPWFDYLLASRPEVEALLSGTGWRLARTIDSPAPQYVAVIEKA